MDHETLSSTRLFADSGAQIDHARAVRDTSYLLSLLKHPAAPGHQPPPAPAPVPAAAPVAALVIDAQAVERDMRALHRARVESARFCVAHRAPGERKFHQEFFVVREIDDAVRAVTARPGDAWLSQATLRPGAVRRTSDDVMLLNAAFCDIDLLHPPATFTRAFDLPPGHAEPERACELILKQISAARMPLPIVLWTGGGLLLKWVHEPIVADDQKTRWDVLQKHISAFVARLGGENQGRPWAWPVDRAVIDAARVLRLDGTINPRWGSVCRALFTPAHEYIFDELCDAFLPYTRREVAEFKLRAADWTTWTKNRQAAAAAGIRQIKAIITKAESMADEAARELWQRRFVFAKTVLAARGSVAQGRRDAHWWPVATAAAWCSGDGDDLRGALRGLHADLFAGSGFGAQEAIWAAGSVMKRRRAGTLYSFKTSTFLSRLDVTPPEMARFGHLLGGARSGKAVNEGIMGFEPMRDLAFDDYIRETRRRQSEAAKRTNSRLAGDMAAKSAQVRRSKAEPAREQARAMRDEGKTQEQIAATIGVSQMTVSRWLRF